MGVYICIPVYGIYGRVQIVFMPAVLFKYTHYPTVEHVYINWQICTFLIVHILQQVAMCVQHNTANCTHHATVHCVYI